MKAAIFFVFCLLAFASAQNKIVRLTIDDFSLGFTAVTLTIPANPSFPLIESDTFTDSGNGGGNLLGGERTVIIEVDNGSQGRNFQSIVDCIGNNCQWDFSTPVDDLSEGSATLQIDGKDDSIQVDVDGLGGIDITEGGLGEAFVINLRTDVDTVYTFFVYSPNGGVCERAIGVPGQSSGTQEEQFLVDFDDFSGDCSFQNVGALEINVFSDSKVDAIASFFGTFGDEDTTASRTPSPSRTRTPQVDPSNTRTPSRTRTPTRTPSPDPSQSRTPSPQVEECMCHCPIFTCALIFDPDDDENNAYYFDDDDDFENIDDDGNVTYFDESSSNGTIIKISIALFAVVAAFAF